MPQRFLDGAARREGADGGLGDGHDTLTTLLDIGQALSSELEMRHALQRVLEYLERDRRIVRGAVMMLKEETGEIRIDVSLGLGDEARSARYKLGEGISGRVIESGHPIVVPAMSREPLFNHRVQRHREQTFICVPIAIDRKPIGALAIGLEYSPARDHEAEQRFFRVIASMIAQGLRTRRPVGECCKRLLEEYRNLRSQLQQRSAPAGLVGNSGPMRQVYEQIAQVAPTDNPVLICGERGTGKELMARAIHHGSSRARGPFIRARVSAVPDALIESFLFGQEYSAFIGGQSRRQGRFELAEGGTLFLDDVGELSGVTQAKLLRVLQQRELDRLGGNETIKTNVRVVAGTGKDLKASIASGEFREDLHDCLAMSPIQVPPLRDRKADIMLLVHHFLARHSQQHGKIIRRISTPATEMLVTYQWPGNVRELEDTVEHAVLACDGESIHGHHLPPSLQAAEAGASAGATSLAAAVERFEKDLVLDAIKSSRGNISKAARLLNTTERIIGYKTRKYCIAARQYRSRGSPALADRSESEEP